MNKVKQVQAIFDGLMAVDQRPLTMRGVGAKGGKPSRIKIQAVGVESGQDIDQVNPTDGGQLVDTGLPIFASMSIDDVNQGYLADCYFLSYIGAVVQYPKGRAFLRKIIYVDPANPGKAIVTYGRNGITVRIHCDLLVAMSYNSFDPKDRDIWVELLEKTYALFRSGMDQYQSLNYGWATAVAFDLGNTPVSGFALFGLFDQVRSGLLAQIPMCIPTTYTPERGDLIGNHEYTITGIDKKNNITLRNPWGGDSPYVTLKPQEINYNNFSGVESGTLPTPDKAVWPSDEDIVNAGLIGGVTELDMKSRVIQVFEMKGLGM